MSELEGKYWGGSCVRDGKVRPLKARSFREFVETQINAPRMLSVTREGYDALAAEDEDRAFRQYKDGAYFLPSSCTPGTIDRSKEACVALVLLCLDFDSPTPEQIAEGFRDYAQDIVDDPQAVLDQLHPYQCAIYETISSREGRRCVRIVVALSGAELKDYPLFMAYVCRLLGIDQAKWKGAAESGRYWQAMFRPAQFEGDEHSPVLASRVTGEPLTLDDLPADLEEDLSDEVKRTYHYEGEFSDAVIGDWPLSGVTVSDFEEMLSHLNPDCEYPLWFRLFCAARHQFRQPDEARDAYMVLDDWSSRGEKYRGEEETYRKWRSARPEVPGRPTVTLRSVIKLARGAGWSPEKLTVRTQRSVEEWIKDQEDAEVLMHEAPRRIAAMPFSNEMVEEDLAIAVKQRVKELTGRAIDKRSVLKAIRGERRREKREKAQEEDNAPPWLRPFAFVGSLDKFVHMGNGRSFTPPAFDRYYSHELMGEGRGDEEDLGGRPSILPANFALNLVKIPRAEGVCYDPRYGEEAFFEQDGQRLLNEYRLASLPVLDHENAPKAGKIFRHHILTLTDNPDIVDLVDDYCAWTIQNPGRKVRWMIQWQGVQRCGKGLIGRCYASAIGPVNAHIVNPGILVSNFNDWAYGCQWVDFDELGAKGYSRAEVWNKIKEIVTNDYIPLNRKFEAVRVIRNVLNGMMYTNYRDALFVEYGDGRYYPIVCALQHPAQVRALVEKGHYKTVAMLLNNGGALRAYWLAREVRSDFPVDGPAPESPWRNSVEEESKNPVLIEIEEMIADPEVVLVDKDLIHSKFLHAAIDRDKRRYGSKPSHYLYELGYVPYREGKQCRVNGTVTSVWVHPERYEEDVDGPANEVLRRREEGA